MGKTREILLDPQHRTRGDFKDADEELRHFNSELDRADAVGVATTPRPMSPVDALMRCAPGEEPALSQSELYPLREIIQDTIEAVLTERERYIFDAIATERCSVRVVGDRLHLGKSQVHRIYQQACATLAAHLAENDTIVQHLTKENT